MKTTVFEMKSTVEVIKGRSDISEKMKSLEVQQQKVYKMKNRILKNEKSISELWDNLMA